MIKIIKSLMEPQNRSRKQNWTFTRILCVYSGYYYYYLISYVWILYMDGKIVLVHVYYMPWKLKLFPITHNTSLCFNNYIKQIKKELIRNLNDFKIFYQLK